MRKKVNEFSLPIKTTKEANTTALYMPLRCTYGSDCWLINYPYIALENDEKPTDSLCMTRTYVEHKGTDFAIKGINTIEKEIDVLAAQKGSHTCQVRVLRIKKMVARNSFH